MATRRKTSSKNSILNNFSIYLCSQQFAALFILFLISAAFSQKDGDVKLINGPTPYQGTVAVYYQNAWGTICDDSWSTNDATVICRQLGFERAGRVWYKAKYGEGTGDILVDQIRCPYNADHILQCTPKVKDWGKHDCTHKEDAGVDCIRKTPSRKPSTMPIRLSCPKFLQDGSCKRCSNKIAAAPGECTNQTAVEGVVIAYYNQVWNPVSRDNFGEEEAKVVCNELGYSLSLQSPTLSELWTNWDGSHCAVGKEVGSGHCSQKEVTSNDAFRRSLNTTLLKRLDCKGSERRLLDCYFSEFGPQTQPLLSVATVRCAFKPHQSCGSTCEDSTSCQSVTELYRLRGGLYPWSGRVEVLSAGNEWSTVCNQEWDYADANIVCRALGYGSVKLPYSRHGRGVGLVLYANLKCTGKEAFLKDCDKRIYSGDFELCGHRLDAGVECNVPEVCANNEETVRLDSRRTLQYPYNLNDHVSVKGPQGWGFACADALNARAANVICRSTSNMFGTRIRAVAIPGNHTFYSGSMNCSGSEMSLSACNVSLVKQDKCEMLGAVLDCTQGLPDLVPDLQTLRSSLYYYPYINGIPKDYLECAIEENCLSSSAHNASRTSNRYLLRFSSLTMNWGTTDFQPNLRPDQWQYHSCHRHYHSFEAFIHYDLLDVATGRKAAEGHKASFCLEDSTCFDGGYGRYRCSYAQGISPNCGDLYGSHLDCQWIDVTDIAPGTYILRLHVNPEYLITESDYGNNEANCRIVIKDLGYYWYMMTEACWLSDH